MIAWWGWLLIWLGLGLALIAMLVLIGILLFRKLMLLFAALETLSGKLEILDRVAASVSDSADEHDSTDEHDSADGQRQRVEQLAILAGEDATRQRRDRVREAAHARRDARHETRIARGRALLKVDASTREWFPAAATPKTAKPRRTN